MELFGKKSKILKNYSENLKLFDILMIGRKFTRYIDNGTANSKIYRILVYRD